MQTETIKANGTKVSLTPNCDKLVIDPEGRGSIEYARARNAINMDYSLLFRSNQALAKRLRREQKKTVVSFLKGEVSKNGEGKLIVTFPDKTVARL